MKSLFFSAMVCIIGSLLLSPGAQGQCPGGLADPLYVINGTTWAFQTQDDDIGDGAVGLFQAHVQLPTGINPYLTGILTLTMTSNAGGAVTVQQLVTGKYQVNSTCTGGELFFNANQNAYQYAFVFNSGRTEMYMTSNSNDVRSNTSLGPYAGNHGKASLKTTPLGCPAGLANPLYLLDGTTWSFQAVDYVGSSIGIFVAHVQLPTGINPYLTGVLSVTETTSTQGNVYNMQMFPGRYQIDRDCSGGELLFNTNFNSYHYAFVFADNPMRMLFVSETPIPANANTSGGGFRGNRGEAKPF